MTNIDKNYIIRKVVINLNINQLKYFNTVCEYGKVSLASQILHISQPSLSAAIKELEHEFGVNLFKRQHSGMVLTNEGKIFYELSKDLIMRAEHMKHIMSDIGMERRTLRLGVPPMIGALILPRILDGFQKMYPEIKLEIIENGREELVSKLSEDYLDMIFIPHNEALPSNLVTHKINDLEIVCCTSKNNPLSEKKFVTPADLLNVPLVMFKDSFFQTMQIKNWFSSAGVSPKIMLQTDQLSTLQNMVSKDMAVGFMFKELIKSDSDFSFVSAKNPICAQISLVWKKDSYMLKSMKHLKDYVDNNKLL